MSRKVLKSLGEAMPFSITKECFVKINIPSGAIVIFENWVSEFKSNMYPGKILSVHNFSMQTGANLWRVSNSFCNKTACALDHFRYFSIKTENKLIRL